MKTLLAIIIFILCTSCSGISYVLKQGRGQLALEFDGRDNEDVLKDPAISAHHKKKIKQIIKYKKFFYQYFREDETSIYDETTFLKTRAVTYLVVASKVDEIKPLTHSFPIVGKFPYLGFFSEDDAKSFASELREEKKFETYIREVYAYSTLNQWIFKDNILSSFFVLDEIALARLIFHELFHTLFFIPDEVGLNENLAQFFSDSLVEIYFQDRKDELLKIKEDRKNSRALTKHISKLVRELNQIYSKAKKNKNQSDFKKIRENFIKSKFNPTLKKVCKEYSIKKCWPISREWNNASFVAFLTYESSVNKISRYCKLKAQNPYDFYHHLLKRYKSYLKSDFKSDSSKKQRERSFKSYLLDNHL